jgi:TonB family protein
LASPDHNGDENPSRLGYFAAIFVSALGHIAIFAFVFFIAPRFLHPAEAPPPAYTVKIVDNIPAGDLGSHLPRINRHAANESKAAAPKPAEAQVKTEPHKTELAANDEKNTLKINAPTEVPTEVPTDTPAPTPEPTIEATVEPTPEPTVEPGPSLEPNLEATEEPTVAPTPEPTPQPKKHPSAKPTPEKARSRPKSGSTVAKIAATPSVAQRMAKLRRELLEHHMKDLANNPPPDEEEDPEDGTEVADNPPTGPAGGGPVVAPNAIVGKGYGVGTNVGSAGILKDPEFLLYYKTVQDQIKKAWTFTGGSNDLTATVDFAIGPDGTLVGLKIGTSSNDGAFDDSVIRAIRRAAPFPAPPEKFRDQFSSGIKAVFQLGELKS